MLDELVGPRDEVFHIRTVFVSAVVLTPGQFTVEEANVDGRDRNWRHWSRLCVRSVQAGDA